MAALLNQKTSLFFDAFLLQYIGAYASPLMQTLAVDYVLVAVSRFTELSMYETQPWLHSA